MKLKEVRDYLKNMRPRVSGSLWGIFGRWEQNKPPIPNKEALEMAPGLSVGSTNSLTPIARFSGYGHDCIDNANYVCVLVNYIHEILQYIDELEEENQILINRILRIADEGTTN